MTDVKNRKWPWILLGILIGSSGLFLIMIVFYFVDESKVQSQQSSTTKTVNWVEESIDLGSEVWEFDSDDPLLNNRSIYINSKINELAANKVVSMLTYFNSIESSVPITIYLSSYGGLKKSAIAIISSINASPSPVNTIALGDCSSACSMILASGTGERKMGEHSLIGIHTSENENNEIHSYNRESSDRGRRFWQSVANLPTEWLENSNGESFYLEYQQAIAFGVVDELYK